jgi:hypothetical protein
MDVIYYYCFLFYKKILKEEEPYSTTVWALGFLHGFFFSTTINLLFIYFFHFKLEKWELIGIGIFFLIVTYLYFNKSKRSKKIIKNKPSFWGNHQLSIILSSIYFLILITTLFWGPILTRYILIKYELAN